MRIFVSHSTAKDNAAGIQRLRDLKQALEVPAGGAALGHEVLLDFERLEPAAKWRSDLDEWMASCHTAVLMLDASALKSQWVLKEATILAHRAACDEDFLLFPALLDGVKREDLSKGDSAFSKLYLDAIQRLSKTDAAGIAEQVKQRLAQLNAVPSTPLEDLAGRLAIQLKDGDRTGLERISERMTGKPVRWSAQDSRAERCAAEIARAIVRGERGGFPSLRALIRGLSAAGVNNEAAERALKLAAPLWVAAPAAAPLADLGRRNLAVTRDAGGEFACWAAVLNGAYVPTFTAEMYLRRAFLPDSETLRTIDGGESDARADDLIDRIRIEAGNREKVLRGAKSAAIDNYLARLTMPYFIVLPPPMPDEATLRTLQDRFPRVTFIAHAGDDLPDMKDWPSRVVPLTPAVDLELEQAASEDYSGTYDDIGGG